MTIENAPFPLGPHDDKVGEEDTVHTVRLLGVPVRVLDAARQQHDEVMHEFALLAVAEDLSDDLPQRMLQLIDTLGRRYSTVREEPEANIDRALEAGEDTVDLTYEVGAHVVEAADHLGALMDEADDFCRREQMLTLERSEILRRFAKWYLTEFRRQVAGEPPKRWDGPLDP